MKLDNTAIFSVGSDGTDGPTGATGTNVNDLTVLLINKNST
jgi:glycerate-2-kinase